MKVVLCVWIEPYIENDLSFCVWPVHTPTTSKEVLTLSASTSPLPYTGNKSCIVNTILSVMPKHTVYIDPCMGSAEVFFRNESVARLLPYKHRTGVITRAGLWKLYPEEKESFFEALTQEDVDEFLATGTEDCTGLPELKEMTANDFYRFCALGYAANNYDGQAFALKAQYYRHADGRDDGLKKIDPDSAEAFADWLENREKGGHPWEVCRGGNSTHVSLYVGLGRVAEGCYHLALAAKSYGRCVEAIKFYLALKHAGLPVIIYGAEFIKKRLLGLERVGIVPNEVMPFYCHSRFPGEDVDSFRHLNHENPDAEIALIEWQPIKPVKLKENAHE